MLENVKRLCETTNRTNEVHAILDEAGLPYGISRYDHGTNFILHYGDPFRRLLIAHYDSYPGSPGANDNVASVVELIELAKRDPKDVTIVLVDQEEQIIFDRRKMGSWHLAHHMIREGITPDSVVVLDVCGAGDTLILAEGSDQGLYSLGLKRPLVSLPTPPSDDLALRSVGIPCSLLSVLPKEEVYGSRLTWCNLHTSLDTPDTIWESTLEMMVETLVEYVAQPVALSDEQETMIRKEGR